MNIHPKEEQKQKLRIIHQTSRNHHVHDRIRCVLLSANGWMPGIIAQSQLIHETTIRLHLNDWLNGEKFALENGSSNNHLSEEKKR